MKAIEGLFGSILRTQGQPDAAAGAGAALATAAAAAAAAVASGVAANTDAFIRPFFPHSPTGPLTLSLKMPAFGLFSLPHLRVPGLG